ncbi:MAG: alpha/beta hydrolase, partial [Candidatus Latescibacteria bacterium]|nr:alpha/beta hydrolase [Candidatus Latescibacterota bacterium]
PSRPQTPLAPFPYHTEDVVVDGGSEGVKLEGTLTIPDTGGPFPAVVLISGSGPQDRDETLAGHRPFWVLADHLSRNGIAVLRYDDRGVGASTGKFETATTVELADDARAMHTFLLSRGDVDRNKVGLIGHSEGGIIAPMLASQSEEVAFIVMLAGPGLRGDEILYLQTELISRAMGLDETAIRQSRIDSEAMYAIIRSESDQQKMVQRLRTYRTGAMAGYTEEMLAEIRKYGDPEKLFEASLGQLTAPWFRFFLDYDPIPSLKKTSCPVLALIGERDMQVPPLQNIPAIEEALQQGVSKEFSVEELPGLNHLFQKAKTGSPGEYGSIEETFAPSALKVISDWVLDQSARL